AAEYIAKQFEQFGLETPPGQDDYFQAVPFRNITPPATANMTFGDLSYQQGKEMVIRAGEVAFEVETEAIYLGFGWIDSTLAIDDYAGKEVAGKIIVTDMGGPGFEGPGKVSEASGLKRAWAAERGAVALIEIYNLGSPPWRYLVDYLNRPTITLDQQSAGNPYPEFTIAWIQDKKQAFLKKLEKSPNTKLQLTQSGMAIRRFTSNNVMGLIPGQDSARKGEYILLSAHYDHVGTGRNGGSYGPNDSIFNGARDNGMGTTALLAAAEALSQDPPSRSVICLAVTGEEIGLLGSKYYADNPLIPLEQTIFDLNTDGAGYNDTTTVTVIGLDRTSAQITIEAADDDFPLTTMDDPLKEMQLFDRSDNASFARKGVPSINLSPGITAFDKEIQRYYHRPADEVDDLNFSYL
ncbi:MAG: M28 family peptidase, partial [Bacteroidota bacterium]